MGLRVMRMEFRESPSKFCCPTGAKNFADKAFCVSKKICYRQLLDVREGVSPFSLTIVSTHSTEKIRKRTFPGFEKILVLTNFSGYEGGTGGRKDEVSQFLVE